MDQLLVDCGPSSSVRVGDEVVLLGRDGDRCDEWAAALGTINYEILCGIGRAGAAGVRRRRAPAPTEARRGVL